MAIMRSMVANGYGYSLANIQPKSGVSADGKALRFEPLAEPIRPLRMRLTAAQTSYDTSTL
jgi:hypothetical protein